MGAKKKTTAMSGRKRKRTYNTSGLRRGLASGASFNASCSSDCPQAQDLCGSEDSDEGGWTVADSTREHHAEEEEEEEAAHTDIEEIDAWESVDNEDLCQQLVDLVCLHGDDLLDETWLPSRRLKEIRREKQRKLTAQGNESCLQCSFN